jgi:hypothetical protein
VLGIVRGYGERSDDAAGFETLRAREEACLQGKVYGRDGRKRGDDGGWDLILFAFVFGAAALLSFLFFSFPLPLLLLLSSFNYDALFAH